MFPKIGFLILGSLSWLPGTAASAQEACGVPEEAGPRIEAATPMVVLNEGAAACACGVFPDRAALEGLRIDGRPVEASVDELGRVATFRLPAGLGPGGHTLTGAPEAGYSPGERAELRLVTVESKLTERLFGRALRLRITVHGTEESVELRVENRNPGFLVLDGGPVLRVRTSGGRKNRAVVRGRRIARSGRGTVTTGIALPVCPCAGGAEDGIPAQRVAELEACLASAVAQLRGWFDRRTRELAVRAERDALDHSRVVALVEELERRVLGVLATPELAALRAWAEDELARERERWRGTEAAAGRLVVRPADLGTASLRVARAQGSPSGTFTEFLDRLSSFFSRLDEVSSDLVVDLCVRSRPGGVNAWVQPRRYSNGRTLPKPTATEFKNLSRGLYEGRVEGSGRSALFAVDLVREYWVYVECCVDVEGEPPCDSRRAACDYPERPRDFECRPEAP